MTTTALVFLILAVVLVWGGLAVSIALLRRDGAAVDEASGPAPDVEQPGTAPRR